MSSFTPLASLKWWWRWNGSVSHSTLIHLFTKHFQKTYCILDIILKIRDTHKILKYYGGVEELQRGKTNKLHNTLAVLSVLKENKADRG